MVPCDVGSRGDKAFFHSVTVLILVHDDLRSPVEVVFYFPMPTDHRVETLSAHRGAEHVIRDFDIRMTSRIETGPAIYDDAEEGGGRTPLQAEIGSGT